MSSVQPKPIRVLAVDDEKEILDAYRLALLGDHITNHLDKELGELENELFAEPQTAGQEMNLDLVLCSQGEDAIKAVEDSLESGDPFSLVFMDVRIPPGIDGVAAAEMIRKIDKDIQILFVTAYSDVSPAKIVDRLPPMEKVFFIKKPCHSHEIQQFALSMGAKWRTEKELQATIEKLQNIMEETVSALTTIVENRDPYTSGHQRRVAHFACRLAESLGMSQQRIAGIRMAGLLHDIGKIYVPSEILNRPGVLRKHETDLIKHHPKVGFDILEGIEFPWPVAKIVLQHHERLDGSGYPQGLKGNQILPEAMIIGVADVVESLASHRPYRPSKGIDAAKKEIRDFKGSRYDEKIVDACLEILSDDDFIFEEGKSGKSSKKGISHLF